MRRPDRLPPYVQAFTDRNGHARFYLRRKGCPRVALPGLPWSPTFMAAYEKAMQTAPQPQRGASGTIGALIGAWYSSADYKALRGSTAGVYRNIAERFRASDGHRLVRDMEPHHVRRLLAARADTPAAANTFLKVLRSLMRFAVEDNWRPTDPTYGVRRIRDKTAGFHTWTEAEIAQFEAAHPVGSRARLAFDLLLWTGQRRADVVRMGRQHLQAGFLDITQEKTGERLAIPVSAALRASIDAASPADHLTFLVTAAGAPFTAAGFGNWFRDCCREAGLPDACSAHGLRKAMARRLAERGRTTQEIKSVTGHRTLSEVERYTRATDQRRLAESAMDGLETGTKVSTRTGKSVNPSAKSRK